MSGISENTLRELDIIPAIAKCSPPEVKLTLFKDYI